MLRTFKCVVVLLGLALPALAADRQGSISGYVRSSAGVPQMGAVVEVLSIAAQNLKVFTDDRGFYSVSNLIPGTYTLKVTAPSFLPALRDRIGLRAGSTMVVNVTLNTLFDAIQLGPLRGPADDDDWKWTLRSAANRPILRVLTDDSQGPELVVKEKGEGEDHDLKASLSFLAGSPSEGYGTVSDMSTGFSIEHKVLSEDAVRLQGNVGYGQGAGAAILRTSYTHHADNGSEPTVALTVRRLAPPVGSFRQQGLQAFGLTTTDEMQIGNVLELKFGSELQTVQFMGRFTAFRPFGTADLHVSPNTVLEYRFASSRPSDTMTKDGDIENGEVGQSGPRVSIASFSPALERARHHEVSLSHRIGKNNMQVAFYSDRVTNTVLTGVGMATAQGGELLPDVDSGTFSYQGTNLDTNGVRVVLQRKLSSDLTATLDYAYGGVLDLTQPDIELQDARQSLTSARRHAVTAKFNGKLPGCRTQWTTSYGWVNGRGLTQVDMFNASAGQSDPYLNVFVRQPLPGFSFLPVHMEAMLDLRNLMAQGYVPVMGQDGRTVYLVQSARSVRGGVAFTF
jgi:Carboxypeptidase regulatory-like domain